MSSLPSDIVTEVLSRVPLRSILRFRSVSKTWQNTIDSFQFATMQLSNATSAETKTTSFIFLPARVNKSRAVHLVELINSDSLVFKTTKLDFSCPHRMDFPVYSNPYVKGLLCFCSDACTGCYKDVCFAYIYNPATKDTVKLPQITIPPLQLEKVNHGVVPGFGFHESTKEYKVVQLFYWMGPDGTTKSDGRVFTLGSKHWRRLENVPNVHCCRAASSTSINGCLHWFSPTNGILVLDLESESFGLIAFPQFTILPTNGRYYHPREFKIMNLGGCLSICDASYDDHIELWIMKEYNVPESWIKHIVSRAYGVDRMPFTKVLPISIWKNGEILLLYDSRILVLYDIESDQYTPLRVYGIPEFRAEGEYEVHSSNNGDKVRYNSYGNYEVYPYVGSLMSLKLLCKIEDRDGSGCGFIRKPTNPKIQIRGFG